VRWPYGIDMSVRHDQVTFRTAKLKTLAKILNKYIDFGATDVGTVLDLPAEMIPFESVRNSKLKSHNIYLENNQPMVSSTFLDDERNQIRYHKYMQSYHYNKADSYPENSRLYVAHYRAGDAHAAAEEVAGTRLYRRAKDAAINASNNVKTGLMGEDSVKEAKSYNKSKKTTYYGKLSADSLNNDRAHLQCKSKRPPQLR